ncbi:MAG TPA: hypothetical protein VLQ67_03870 [Arachnia sp.]|nr:hypothetical protein [Arachnia sp.]
MSRRARCWMLIAAVATMLWWPSAAVAQDGEAAAEVAGVVRADGTLRVTQTLTFDAPVDELTQVLALTRSIDSSHFHRYRISNIAATVAGEAVDLATTTNATQVEIRMAVDGVGPLILTYDVHGATRTEQGQDGALTMLQWPMVQGLPMALSQVAGVVEGPALPDMIGCEAGPRGSVGRCAALSGGTFDQPDAAFQDGPRDAGDEVVLSVAYPADEVAATADLQERWSLDRAFTVSWPTVLAALGAALLGGALLLLLHRRAGRDLAPSEARAIGSFAPVGHGESVFRVAEGVRPGHVGTVADERVDPIDVTATLVDLAVRGHLLITELPRPAHGLLDWTIERTEAPVDDLARFEQELLDAVAPVGERTLVSRLSGRLADRIVGIQDALYDDVVARGWFEQRPDSTRSSWRTRGYVVLGLAFLAAVLLVAFTTLGLMALVLVSVGAAVVWVADRMPRRTAAGTALLDGLGALSSLLATHTTAEMPRGRELQEISRLLGYTVVLGGKERWLEAMVAADDDDTVPDPAVLSWYHAPGTWHLQDLPASMTQFIHTVQGALYSR